MSAHAGRFNSLLQFSSPGKGSQTNQTLQNLVVNDVLVSGAGFAGSAPGSAIGDLQGRLRVEKAATLSLEGSESLPNDSRGSLQVKAAAGDSGWTLTSTGADLDTYDTVETDRVIQVDLANPLGGAAAADAFINLTSAAQQGQLITVVVDPTNAGFSVNVDAAAPATKTPAGAIALGDAGEPVSATFRYQGTSWAVIGLGQNA